MNLPTQTVEPKHSMRRTAAWIIALLLIAVAIFLASGGVTHNAERPGIFGTRANLFTDLNLIAQLLLLAGLCAGALLARKGNIPAHQYLQTGLVLFNIILTFFIMLVAYAEYVIPGMPAELSQAHGIVSTIHSILGLAAILCGVYLVLRMNRLLPKSLRIKAWKTLMRITLGLYLLVGLIGVGVYYVWFMR